ncbi:MAG: DEAD/DEAH box helicase family protein [Oscillospiraceae bacterium]|nr:DEAD/DEAH box helicase family protein [Oscillospiraceae bacterium]
MAKKYELITELYERTRQSVTEPAQWQRFLNTACRNYRLSFDEQLLLFAQCPDATAVLEIEKWNRQFGRWVNRGATGIAVFNTDTASRTRLKYYFDISDTHPGRFASRVPVWEMRREYEGAVTEALENSFGELENRLSLAPALLSAARNAVEDNMQDYLAELRRYKDGSFLEELDDLNLEVRYRTLLAGSVGYMLLARCGIDPSLYFSDEDFRGVVDFNTTETLNTLGVATSDISQMCLSEIARTVRAQERQPQNQNRTFAQVPAEEYPVIREANTERSAEHERAELQNGERVPPAQPAAPGRAGGDSWEIRIAETPVSERTAASDLHEPADDREADGTPDGNREGSNLPAGADHGADGESRGRDGDAEGNGSDDLGAADEQHPAESRGDDSDGADLQLSGHDFDARTEIAYYHQDAEKQELIRTSDALKDHRVTIAAYFAEHEDRRERGNFIKSFFDGAPVEKTLSNGQAAGYRAYDDLLMLWRGSYENREVEVYLRWQTVADDIYGMILTEQWLSPDERPLPTEGEQISMLAEAQAEKENAFVLPQAAIDYILTHGSGYAHGKYRIYEQFQKGGSAEENVKFLKNEYGVGGHSDAIPGTGYWEDHDSKGILIRPNLQDGGSVLLRWPKVEKRIRELIASDRYLSNAEKEAYPAYRQEEGIRAERGRIANEFEAVVKEYGDYLDGLGEASRLPDRWYLVSCATAFTVGDKKMYARTGDGDFILPMMRAAMETIIADKSPLRERAEAVLKDLHSEQALPFEPTEEELNPPPKEYRITPGATVHIGTQEYEVVFYGADSVVLQDTRFPLLQSEYSQADFLQMIAENPLNDQLLHDIEEVVESQEIEVSEEADEIEQSEAPKSRVDEMLRQALLAAELSERTGQDVFAFEEGNPEPVNVPKPEPAEKETVLAPPAPRARSKLTPTMIYPEIKSDYRCDFQITDDRLGVGTPHERFHHNIMAIQLLKKLESEHRPADSNEQRILADYVGWGGLADFFDENNPHYPELRVVLTDEELSSARESTLTAFYTPPVVIRAMYQAMENLGFQNGNVLEPSCGIGHFMGMKPESMADARIFGVELDSISGRIAQQLYQKSSIAVQGFEKTELPDSFFDVAIGNIPFGNFKLSDKRYDKHNFLIHDYFFAKTLDKVRPGGIVAFVTSKGTMDKESPVVRKYIAQRAELLGAVRLPNNTFKDAAGTDVTSDILFLQKRDTLTLEEPDWVHLNTDANGLRMNQYFVDHPEMILGEMREISGPYGPETACIPYEDQDLGELLTEAVQGISGSLTEYETEELAEEEEDLSIPADPSVRNFSYTLVDGKVYYRENSRMAPVNASVTAESRIKGLIGIRDCVRQLIAYQTEDYPDSMIEAEQARLNALYDAFSAKYGIINSRANKSVFNTDNSYFLLSSLEVLDDEGNFVRKADMFSRRTIKQRVEITHVDTASEALAVSLAEKAHVDMDYMMELSNKTEEEIYTDLRGVIFMNPLYKAGSGNGQHKYLPADEYLSGNVREKLRTARLRAEASPEFFAPNVEALEKVQPVDLTAAEISVRVGTTWIPPEDYEDFMYELFGTPFYARWKIKVHFSSYTGEWNIEGKSGDSGNIRANSTFGTDRINGYKILEQTLNLKDVRIFDYIEDAEGRRVPVLNKKETAIAQAKQEQIKQAFQEWIWKEPSRRERLTKLYNEKFNSIRPREYDGSHLSLAGINPEISLRQHQLNAVARGLYGGNELLGHVVGAGKTFTMVALAQESKRLGLCQKSLIVVPNHLTEQWASEYLQLYPSANILVATAKDFETKNRKRFCGRIATGDYDAIIIGHSQLEKIPLSFARQQEMLQQQMDEIMDGIMEIKRNRGDRFSIKQLERSKKQIQAKLDRLNDQSRKDDVVTFEELGVDRLFIDEAHYYKNLAAFTKMRNVGGISQTEAQKSSDLYMKCRYLDELTGGHGVIFATGTPISNTMVEMYTMQKYLQYDTLHRNELIHFDSWASTFGETVTAIELAPEGTGYRAKTRFAKFYNLPELMTMFKEVADIQTADMLNLPVPNANYHNVVLKPSEIQKEMVDSLAKRAEKVRSGMVNSSQDNMLVITNDGRKLALDQRLMNELLPESETGKVAACAQNVFEIWQRTAPQCSTQMIFCDLSTPHNDGHFNVYDAIRDKLIAKGIPAEEIAYIHEANTEVKKKELFGKVRSGQIRVLLGSTQKMGAGTNVQKKLIALHHLDCPWRPADLQQREGRIVRQGNENPEVDIFTYVTENTFDSYLYQLVESKQKFIGQIMTSKSPVRSAEDIDETALSYAEIKALCSGNPEIKEKMDLDVAVSRLKLLKANHLSQRYALEDQIIKDFPQQISAYEQRIEAYREDMERLAENTHPNADGFSPMIVEGITFTEKKAAGSAILEACQNMTSPAAVPIGRYRGFAMELSYDTLTRNFKISMIGSLTHTTTLGADVFGNIQRMDNLLEGFEDQMHNAEAKMANVKVQLENARAEVEKPFPQEEELKEKTARLNELNIKLNMDKRENEIVDGDRDEDEKSPTDRKKEDRDECR